MKLKYNKCFVAYIDVLGFRARILNMRSKTKEIKSIYTAFSEVKKFSKLKIRASIRKPNISTKIKMFSDNIVISSVDISKDSFYALLGDVGYLQALLSSEGFFLRGCITAGDHYQDDSIIFGPAVINAIDLEKIARWPRVMLDPYIFTLTEIDRSSLVKSQHFRVDPVGILYVDYLTMYFQFLVLRQEIIKDSKKFAPENILMKHQSAILNALKSTLVKSDLAVLLKYQELTNYHNAVIRKILDRYAKNQGYISSHYTIVNEFQEFLNENGKNLGDNGPETTRDLYEELIKKIEIDPIKEFAKLHGK